MLYTEYDLVEGEPAEQFSDFDDLLYQWRQFVNENLNEFNVISSDLFGTGCVCDLKQMVLNNNFSPEYVMSLMPRVSDCASECLYMEYGKLIHVFLERYVNTYGSPMTIVDLGNEEITFYNEFEKVARQRMVWNTWDLYRIDGLKNTK
ncbi:MAG TPA: hypothetical protein PLW50_00160 [Smithellaceae bacterium]|nr:hypothetical protein [Smithellaceae bacterium]